MQKRITVGVLFCILSTLAWGQYTARTDTNVTQPDASAINFGGLSGANTAFTDSLYDSIGIMRCTDASTNPAHSNFEYEVGLDGSGDKVTWNTADNLLGVNDQGGRVFIFRFNPATNTCSPVCGDGDTNLHCTGSSLYSVGPGVFSRSDAHTYYSFYWTVQYKVVPLTIPDSGAPSNGTAVADFSPALYKSGVPTWTHGTVYTLGQVIQPTTSNIRFQVIVPGTGGTSEPVWSATVNPYFAANVTTLPVPDWPGAGQSVALNAIIQPTSGNAANDLYQAISCSGSCVTGSSEPSWLQTFGGTQTDGTITWKNLGGSAKIADGSAVLVNVGPTATETWNDPGGVENEDHLFATLLSYNGIQDTGGWALVYDNQANVIYQINTYTGIETDFTCTGGTGFQCTGGTWVASVIGRDTTFNLFTVHNGVLAPSGGGYFAIAVGNTYGSDVYPRFWRYGYATMNGPTRSPEQYGGGHWADGVSHWTNMDGPNGTLFEVRNYSSPGTYNPLWSSDPSFAGFDSHMSWVNNLGSDQEPIIGATSTHGPVNGYPHTYAGQDEILAVTTCGQTGEASCPGGYSSNTQWRLGRNFNFATNSNDFSSWVSIGALSQTGKYYALSSTGLGTMGGSTCSGGSCTGSASCLGGFSWQASHSYGSGTLITPNPGINNHADYVFKAFCSGITIACTSGTTEPTWSQDGVTSTTDGAITWKPQGLPNCRSDVLIYTLPKN